MTKSFMKDNGFVRKQPKKRRRRRVVPDEAGETDMNVREEEEEKDDYREIERVLDGKLRADGEGS